MVGENRDVPSTVMETCIPPGSNASENQRLSPSCILWMSSLKAKNVLTTENGSFTVLLKPEVLKTASYFESNPLEFERYNSIRRILMREGINVIELDHIKLS